MFKCVLCDKVCDDCDESNVARVCQPCFDDAVENVTPAAVDFANGDAHSWVQWLRDAEIDRRRAELAKKSAKISREIYELAHGEPDDNWREPIDDDFAYDEWVDNQLSLAESEAPF